MHKHAHSEADRSLPGTGIGCAGRPGCPGARAPGRAGGRAPANSSGRPDRNPVQEFSNGTRRPLPPPPTSLPSHTFFLLAGQQETAFSLFSSSAWSTSRSDFTALTNYSMATFPNVFGCFLVQKVNGSDRAAYEEFAINQGGARQSADSAL